MTTTANENNRSSERTDSPRSEDLSSLEEDLLNREERTNQGSPPCCDCSDVPVTYRDFSEFFSCLWKVGVVAFVFALLYYFLRGDDLSQSNKPGLTYNNTTP